MHPTTATPQTREKDIQRDWHLINIKNKILGRVVSEISTLLQGKHKIYYVPHLDCGDYVVVVNAKDVVVTGRKSQTKTYKRYSGYPGGLKEVPYKKLIDSRPAEIITHAVSGMLPKNKLRTPRLRRLYVFAGDKHTFEDKLKSQNSKSKSTS